MKRKSKKARVFKFEDFSNDCRKRNEQLFIGPAVSNANLESRIKPVAKRPDAAKTINKRVDIVVSVSGTRADIDNVCCKYAIDCIVNAGVLQDDRPEMVRSVKITHEDID